MNPTTTETVVCGTCGDNLRHINGDWSHEAHTYHNHNAVPVRRAAMTPREAEQLCYICKQPIVFKNGATASDCRHYMRFADNPKLAGTEVGGGTPTNAVLELMLDEDAPDDSRPTRSFFNAAVLKAYRLGMDFQPRTLPQPPAPEPIDRWVKVISAPFAGPDRHLYEGKFGKVVRTYTEPASEWSGKPEYQMTVVAIEDNPMLMHFRSEDIESAEKPKPTNPIAKFFGTWPGDESDKELLEALDEVRKPTNPNPPEPRVWEVLNNLCKEVSGMIGCAGLELNAVIGNTNVAVLRHHLEAAETELKNRGM